VSSVSVNVTIDDWILDAVDDVLEDRAHYRVVPRNRSQLIEQLLEGFLDSVGYEYPDDNDDPDDPDEA